MPSQTSPRVAEEKNVNDVQADNAEALSDGAVHTDKKDVDSKEEVNGKKDADVKEEVNGKIEADGEEEVDGKEDADSKEEKKREPVGRADQIWNKQKRRFEYFKTRTTKARKYRFTRYVIFVRRQIGDKGFPAGVQVDIKGPRLRQALEDLNKDTKEFGFDDDPPTIDPKIMYHSLEGLRRLEAEAEKEEPKDETLLFELRAGIEYVNDDFESTFSQLETLRPKKQITFNLLWTLFPPNTVIRTDEDRLGHPRAFIVRTSRVQHNDDGSVQFILNTDYIDSDGEHIGWVVDNRLIINEFNGVKDILDLQYYPLNSHPDAEKMKAEHVAAGKIAMQRHGRRLVGYRGHAIREGPRGQWIKFNPHGRLMLDPESFEQTQPENGMVPTNIDQIDLKTLDDEKIMLMCTMVYGFSLGDKLWGMFSVAQTSEIVWNDEVFDSLVVDAEQKSFVHDLVHEHRAKDKSAFDDVVQDKGKGLVGLLAGPPGVGKTLTAEAIAEVTRRPLYMISSGELGESPSVIHEKLTGILELTELWDAVLLLDEADVFLAARDDFNLARNAIISIFLRELEYYQGVIILTTNRITSIDAAFQSRIHFSLKYPDLDRDGRIAIWQYFVAKARKHAELTVDIEMSGIKDLALHDMNGRQIKNAMSVSQAVALKRKEPLTVKAIETAMKLSQHFQNSESTEHLYN